jgi:hypothetical protein
MKDIGKRIRELEVAPLRTPLAVRDAPPEPTPPSVPAADAVEVPA